VLGNIQDSSGKINGISSQRLSGFAFYARPGEIFRAMPHFL
jgi:hypothetical protein